MTTKFLADWRRCIKCGGCEVACKRQNGVPEGERRIRVVTIAEGTPDERNVPMPCFHCDDAPCVKVCPPRTLYKTAGGAVLHTKDTCIGCGYCVYACPFGAPQFPGGGIFGGKGKMDKCSQCMQPFEQKDAGGKPVLKEANPRCAAFCATKALLAGDANEISAEYRKRVAGRITGV